MFGELLNIRTETLFDLLFVMLSGGVVLTASDVAEIEQIQRELQTRGETKSRPCAIWQNQEEAPWSGNYSPQFESLTR